MRSSTSRAPSTAGLAVDTFAPRLSFFFAAHNDLFEEVAKFRAARRLYARIMRERFRASEASARLRFHTQTGGVTLQAQQPLNNVVRVTVQALAGRARRDAVAAHQRLRRGAWRCRPSEAATLALRTQQIIANESGAAPTADPLAGSYYVEHLTNEIERRAQRAARRGSTNSAAPPRRSLRRSSRKRSRAARTSISFGSKRARR